MTVRATGCRRTEPIGVCCRSMTPAGFPDRAALEGAPGSRAVVVMARNATPSKVAATRGYGAEVIQHGSIWDEANEEAQRLVRERGLTSIHPFDDLQLIAGQGTIGLEIL